MAKTAPDKETDLLAQAMRRVFRETTGKPDRSASIASEDAPKEFTEREDDPYSR